MGQTNKEANEQTNEWTARDCCPSAARLHCFDICHLERFFGALFLAGQSFTNLSPTLAL